MLHGAYNFGYLQFSLTPYAESFYFIFITLSSIGFGSYTPPICDLTPK